MKADLPLEQRLRIETARQCEIRAALVRRHFEVIAGQRAIDAALLDNALRIAARAVAVWRGAKPTGPVPTKVAAPAMVTRRAPSGDSLRSALGLG